MQLHDLRGRRPGLTAEERRTFTAAAAKAERPVRTLGAVLHDTGRRIIKALTLAPERVELGHAVVFERPAGAQHPGAEPPHVQCRLPADDMALRAG